MYGYPSDKYSVTVEYFKSLAAPETTTDADPHTEIVNCFRMGYRDPADALRAVRKSGEILGGSWMVGVKWAVGLFIEISVLLPCLSCNIKGRSTSRIPTRPGRPPEQLLVVLRRTRSPGISIPAAQWRQRNGR